MVDGSINQKIKTVALFLIYIYIYIYINDLDNNITSNVLKFADDTECLEGLTMMVINNIYKTI